MPGFKYAYLDHTADVLIRVEGDDLQACFRGASEAVFGFMLDKNIDLVVSREQSFRIESESRQALLYDFIDHLLAEFYSSDLIPIRYGELRIDQDDESVYRLRAVIVGCSYDPEKHGYIDEIKAMTYNEMLVAADGKRIEFVVDI